MAAIQPGNVGNVARDDQEIWYRRAMADRAEIEAQAKEIAELKATIETMREHMGKLVQCIPRPSP